MAMDRQQLREQLSRARGAHSGGGIRYPQYLRAAAARAARLAERDGDSVEVVARELGIAPVTLRRWVETAPPAFLPVEVEPVPAMIRSGAVLITPDGHRVEGLDLDSVAALLRALR